MKQPYLTLMASMLIWAIPLLAKAQPAGGMGGYGAPAPTTLPGEDRLIPEVSFANSKLDDVIDSLRKSIPGFNAVIVRDNGVPADYPTLSNLKMHNVAVGQFMDFVSKSYPGISVERIAGPAGPLYLIRVGASGPYPGVPMGAAGGMPGVPQPFGGGEGFAPGMPMPVPEQPSVQVYKLTDIVNSLAASKPEGKKPEERTKEAMDDVLSLIQAALDQTEKDGPKPVLKVHEPTQVLMFKGTAQTNAVVQQILNTLQASQEEQQAKFRAQLERLSNERGQLRENYDMLRKQEDELHQQERLLRDELEKTKVENAILRAQLDQAKSEAAQSKSGGK